MPSLVIVCVLTVRLYDTKMASDFCIQRDHIYAKILYFWIMDTIEKETDAAYPALKERETDAA